MDWIEGIQRALDYIESNLTEEIDYDKAAREAASSSYHFQRVFSILCGYTLGEYIRMRRLTLAGAELAAGEIKVIDAAVKYGYESPDSFTKAFRKFHGVNPSDAKSGAVLRSFSPLRIKLTLEGASMLNYKIEEKPEMLLTGYKRRFTGTPAERGEQETDFYVSTRVNQLVLTALACDLDTTYDIVTNIDEDGYDFYISVKLEEEDRENMEYDINDPEFFNRFEHIPIPAGLYLVCETERSKYPTRVTEELRRRAVSEWLPTSGYELDTRPEIAVGHWYYRAGDEAYNSSRYIELWLPIVKKT